MSLGIRRGLAHLRVTKDYHTFRIRKWVFGFESANAMLARMDKASVIPILRHNLATIGVNCDIETPLNFHNCSSYENFVVGDNCHIGKGCFFDLQDKVVIEHNVVISMQVTLLTHTDMTRSDLVLTYPATQGEIRIGHDTYFGANCTVLMGVEIGHHSLVAAGSVVTRSFPPNSLIAGVPAELKQKRKTRNVA